MGDIDDYYLEPLPHVDTHSYEMLNTRKQQPLPTTVPTVSTNLVESPSNTVEHTRSGAMPSSSTPLCRIFLIIVASLIIGGVIGGIFSYLLTSKEGSGEICSDISTTTSSCPTCKTCENTTTETAEPEWQLVFKAVAGVADPQETDRLLIDPYEVWKRETPYNEDIPAARQLDTSFRGHYLSSLAVNWQRIREVKVGLFDAAGNELINLIFDAVGSNNTNWFSKDRLLSSPWVDIYCEPQNYFSVIGSEPAEGARDSFRRWHINRYYGGCPGDEGWLAVISIVTGYCDWENGGSKDDKPLFLYSKGDNYTNWNIEQNVGEADIFAIFVKTY